MKKQFVSILAAITILCNLCFTEVYAFEDSTSALKEFTLTENTTFFKSLGWTGCLYYVFYR